MLHTHKSLYDRCLEKTPEQVFVNSLRREFELSPAESLGILELAKSCLFGKSPKTLGKIKILCASRKAKHGRPLGEQEMVRVELTLDAGIEDLDVLRALGPKALRQRKVLRISEEAFDQGGLLTQEDIARVLQVSSRTIRTDMSELIAEGNFVHTRGFDHDIGRSLSHKSRIVDMYLSGLTYDDIMRRSRHSAHAIKRYISSFGRLLLLQSRQISSPKEISRLLGQSEKLTEEYLSLFEKYKNGDQWPTEYIELLEQLKTLYPSKKKKTDKEVAL